MFKKNPNPREIALAISLITTLLILSIHLILLYLSEWPLKWYVVVLPPVMVFTVSYWVVTYFLKQYIYRKIKLIYKTIHKEKMSPNLKQDNIDLRENVIDKVEKEVELWAEKQKEEVVKYKKWADYRRKYIGNISHELKTPVFNIQGYLHTLIQGGLDDPNINKKYLKKAAKNVERLQLIIDDLSTITRLESNQMDMNFEVVNIKELALDVFEEMELKAQDKDINLSFKEGADYPFNVIADRNTIHQVMVNLVTNAIKYNEKGGWVRISFYEMDTNILIEIADNGIGIDKKHLPHLYDRFYRVDKSRTRKYGGSGLGLSIVKHIIEAHKQTITVRSTANVGSTFGFTLKKA